MTHHTAVNTSCRLLDTLRKLGLENQTDYTVDPPEWQGGVDIGILLCSYWEKYYGYK